MVREPLALQVEILNQKFYFNNATYFLISMFLFYVLYINAMMTPYEIQKDNFGKEPIPPATSLYVIASPLYFVSKVLFDALSISTIMFFFFERRIALERY